MKSIKLYFSIVALSLIAFSCEEDLNSNPQSDFRDAFVGIYDCPKGSTVIEIEVTKDPDNENNIIIGPYSIPMDESGSYGPENIVEGTILEVSFDGDQITYREEEVFILGQVLVCTLTGTKR